MIIANNPRCQFQAGDIVTSNGSDEHMVIGSNDIGDLITVLCIKGDMWGVFQPGEQEENLTRRYELVRRKG